MSGDDRPDENGGGDLFVNLGLIAVGLGVVGFVAVFLVALGKHL